MRFRTKGLEAGFVKQRFGRLAGNASSMSLIAVFLAGGIVLHDVFLTEKLHLKHHESEDDFLGYKVQFYCTCAIIGVGLVTSALLRCQCLIRCVAPLALEVTLVVLMTSGMYAVVLSTPFVACKIGGLEAAHPIFGTCKWGAESTLLLIIVGIITLSHFGLPIRWHVLVFMEVMGFLLYVIVTVITGGGRDERLGDSHTAIYNLVILFGIICGTSIGKRHAELGERKAFADILNERSRRCEAEFQLAQAPVGGARECGEDEAKSRSESLPTTTGTGLIFEELYTDGVAMSDKLAQIAEIGDAEHWRIKPTEVQLMPGQCLGSGGFGMVYKGTFCGSLVAVKLPRGKIDSSAAKRLPELCNELRVLRRLRHPNIVTVHGAVIDPEQMRIALILELVQGQRLDVFLHGNQDSEGGLADNSSRYQIMIGICRALLYMHTRSPPTIHGDIKHSNILVEPRGKPRLLDFGLSRVLARRSNPLGGTLAWMPPEFMRESGAPLKRSADIYTFGRLIAYVATGIKPMSNLSVGAVKKALRRGTPPMPTWPTGCPFEPVCRPLAEKCLTTEEAYRPSAARVNMELLGVPPALGLQDSEGDLLRGQSAGVVSWESAAVESCLAPNGHRGGGAAAPPHATASPPPAAAPEPNPEVAPLWPQIPRAAELSNELPPLPEAAPLDCGSGPGSAGGPAPTTTSAPERRIFTSSHAKALTLCEAVARWNAETPEGACCPFHGDVAAAQEVCRQLQELECRPQKLMILQGKQCPSCGILGMEVGQRLCEICDETLSKRHTRRSL